MEGEIGSLPRLDIPMHASIPHSTVLFVGIYARGIEISRYSDTGVIVSDGLQNLFVRLHEDQDASVFAFGRHAQPAPSMRMRECRNTRLSLSDYRSFSFFFIYMYAGFKEKKKR